MADTKVQSEIGGTVWNLLVQVGDRVESDVPLAVVVSMKMEVPIMATDEGEVTEIHVCVGDEVAVGDAILTIRT